MRQKRTIWVCYSSRKGGHTYPSKALYDYIKDTARDDVAVEIINLLDLSPIVSFMDELGRYGDLKLRCLYKTGYQNLERDNQTLLGGYRFVESLLFNISKIDKKLRYRFGKPDIIISLQPEVNVIAHLLKKWFAVPIHTVIIDLSVHSLWVHSCIDHYCVANEPSKERLGEYQLSPDEITVTGMPLRSGFARVRNTDVQQVRKQLNVSPDLPTILIMGGLLGTMIDFETAIASIMGIQSPFQLLVIFGKNEKAKIRAEVLRQKSQYPIHLYGTVSNVNEMMWASDIIVSKPGSVTIAEALSLGKPMVVISPRAGSAQEHRFAALLKAAGAGDWIKSAEDLGASVRTLCASKSTYENMRKNAYALGHHSLTATETIFKKIESILQNTDDTGNAHRTQDDHSVGSADIPQFSGKFHRGGKQ